VAGSSRAIFVVDVAELLARGDPRHGADAGDPGVVEGAVGVVFGLFAESGDLR
jgi:hypothetical protein